MLRQTFYILDRKNVFAISLQIVFKPHKSIWIIITFFFFFFLRTNSIKFIFEDCKVFHLSIYRQLLFFLLELQYSLGTMNNLGVPFLPNLFLNAFIGYFCELSD